jgi:hypothetical protein
MQGIMQNKFVNFQEKSEQKTCHPALQNDMFMTRAISKPF